MPPKRSNIGRRKRSTERRLIQRRNETDEDRANRNELNRQRNARSRSRQTEEKRETQNALNRSRIRRDREASIRSHEDRSQQNLNERIARQTCASGNLDRAAFNYNSTIEYSSHASVTIGTTNKICQYCKALKSNTETPGLCCANGKVKLPALNPPPEPFLHQR